MRPNQKRLKKRIYGFMATLGVFLVSTLGVFLPITTKAYTAEAYTVQLATASDFTKLQSIDSKARQIFTFSSATVFNDIYTFLTDLPEAEVRDALAGHYKYLSLSFGVYAEQIVLNDPGYTTNPYDIDKEWAITQAGFDKAWEKTIGSKDNIVAVIDTGIDATHEDLRSITYVPGYDFFTKQEIPILTNSDDNGHGTLVAGILGATVNNGLGIAGTNWNISLMPLKALDSTGKGDVSLVAEAIVWAADHGASFINLSVGGVGFGHDVTLADAISYAFNKGVLIVAAAGNDVAVTGGNLDNNPVYPICDDNNSNMIIGVAATDQNDVKPTFSNYGGNCVDVTAPGKRILSTINRDPLTNRSAPNSYAFASGTSLGVPFVVGQAALIRSLYPKATNVQIRDRIISTAVNIDIYNPYQCGGSSCKGLLGTGRIQVDKSIEKQIIPNILEGDVVRGSDASVVYLISGGQKRLISPFVFNQRFGGKSIQSFPQSQLDAFPKGPFVTPADGTLVKYLTAPTVYEIFQGQKLPITGQIFKHRKYDFSKVNTLSDGELNSWVTGNFMPPLEATRVKIPGSQTVYWVVGGVMHPVNRAFYKDRGLDMFPLISISKQDFTHYSQGGAYER